jgi:hypothetical protein
VISGIVGLSIPVSPAIAFFIEFNPGGNQISGGTAMMYVFPPSATRALTK